MPRNTLYVTNFSREAKAADLAPDFEKYGDLIRLDIPPPRTDDGQKYAFVEYKEDEAAERALEMHGMDLPYSKEGGLNVQMARSDPNLARNRRQGRRREQRRYDYDYGRYDDYGYQEPGPVPDAYGPRGYGYAPRGGYRDSPRDRERDRDRDRDRGRERYGGHARSMDYKEYVSRRDQNRHSYLRLPLRSPVRTRLRLPQRNYEEKGDRVPETAAAPPAAAVATPVVTQPVVTQPTLAAPPPNNLTPAE